MNMTSLSRHGEGIELNIKKAPIELIEFYLEDPDLWLGLGSMRAWSEAHDAHCMCEGTCTCDTLTEETP